MSDPGDPAPLPTLLEYQTPRPRRESPVNAAWVRFMVGVGVALGAIAALDRYSSFRDSPVMIVIVTVVSGSLFLVADAIRRVLPGQTGRERRAWLTLVVGAACIGVCEGVHQALLGHTDTLAWVIMAWFVAGFAAPVGVYSGGRSD